MVERQPNYDLTCDSEGGVRLKSVLGVLLPNIKQNLSMFSFSFSLEYSILIGPHIFSVHKEHKKALYGLNVKLPALVLKQIWPIKFSSRALSALLP